MLNAHGSVSIDATTAGLSLTSRGKADLHSLASAINLRAKTNIELEADEGDIIAHAQRSLQLNAGDANVVLTAGDSIKMCATSLTDVSANVISISGTESVSLHCGLSSITLTPEGIVISAPSITSDSKGIHTLLGSLIRIN
jgi:uncharacterized protein (DUF2345 family)